MAQLVEMVLVWANWAGLAVGVTEGGLDQTQELDRPLDLYYRLRVVGDV